MSEESKIVPPAEEEEVKDKGKAPAAAAVESDDEADDEPAADAAGTPASGAAKKKKKSKRNKIKAALGGKSSDPDDKEAQVQKALGGLNPDQIAQLLELNPALAGELQKAGGSGSGADGDVSNVADMLKNLKLQEIMTGLASSGKNVKDMGAYKFWSTQPVPKFGEGEGEKAKVKEGPIKVQTVDEVSKEPPPLVAGFEWCTVDLANNDELKEVQELLYGHYVEDDEAMFRFNYSFSILQWAMMPPGWKKEWHVGVRASQSKKLVGFISAVPLELRVRENVIKASEVNFLCIHKKLRSKRLAPVLIKEITRRCNLEGVFQAIYTGGIVLPTPVSTCRYYHRALDWQKLYEVGFSPLPANSKPQYQVRKYAVPERTSTKGLREMQEKDIDSVHSLLTRYLKKFDLAADFTKEDIAHWMVHKKQKAQLEEQVVWSFVVEDENQKITDFFSFYCLESSVINSAKHKNIRAAYLFYYASETGLTTPVKKDALKKRLNELVNDALIWAKKYKFDVFNALSTMENGLFLEDQKFGPGDGQLHYYLFNYRANPIAGGVDKRNRIDDNHLSGVGFTML
jgi:glycylpeptide N-tetradecanoyltransferase